MVVTSPVRTSTPVLTRTTGASLTGRTLIVVVCDTVAMPLSFGSLTLSTSLAAPFQFDDGV